MSDEKRAQRTPRTDARIPEEEPRGHGVGDRDLPSKRAERTPVESSTEVTRTSRGNDEPEEPVVRERTSRPPRTNPDGNISETGAGSGSPVPGTGTGLPRVGSGKPPVGCASTASVLLLTVAAISTKLVRSIRH